MTGPWKVMLGLCALGGIGAAAQPATVSLRRVMESQAPANVPNVSEAAFGTMWTFEDPPLEYWQRTYGFSPSREWLEHAQLSSLRYGERCSASFVSEQGLVLTNHHCASPCIAAISTDSVDYLDAGFRAHDQSSERLCPGLHLDQLVDVEDLFEYELARTPESTDAEAAEARQAVVEQIENACSRQTGLVCQVVPLYSGSILRLYKYRRYEPVKLVFAPERQAAFFGGDQDNFSYPRHSLDVVFLRAYESEGSTPVESPQHFTLSTVGPQEGEPVFLIGNPRSTERHTTVSQWLFEQHTRHPFNVAMYANRIAVLAEMASRSPEAARALQGYLGDLRNSLKAYEGQLRGLRDSSLMARRVTLEERLRESILADPGLRAVYADCWDEMAAVATEKAALFAQLNLYNPDFFIPSPHVATAAALVRYVRALATPEAERPPALRGERLQQVEARLRTDDPLNRGYGELLLAGRLMLAREWLPADDPLIAAAFQPGEAPAVAASRLIGSSSIGDPEFRARIMEGGVAALADAEDPLLELATVMVDQFEPIRLRFVALLSQEEVIERHLATASFETFGTRLSPDATFTLRISDGVPLGYVSHHVQYPLFTTIGGLYERSAERDNEMPWTLPAAFAATQTRLDRTVPLNFVTTNDMTGGSSGSPIIDRDGLLVGVAFDNNEENLSSQFLFGPDGGRAVAVHSAGILEALRHVYRADDLVAEILGR